MSATRWTGKGNAQLWADAANWSAGLPTSGIDARFASGTQSLHLAGRGHLLQAGALLLRADTLTLATGPLELAPVPAQKGNTFDIVLEKQAHLTVAATARLDGSNVAEIGNGTGATLTLFGRVAEAYGVVVDGTLDVSGARGHWVSGDSGLYFDDATLLVEAGGRIDAGGKLTQYPAAALDMQGNSTGLVTGAGSTLRLANVFLASYSGVGTLMVADGGQVFSGGGDIGGSGDGTLIVTGAGSLLRANRGLTIGGQVPVNSTAIVENGGTLAVGSYGLILNGTLDLDSTATLKAPFILSGGGVIESAGGTLAGIVDISAKLALFENPTDGFATKTTYVEAAPGATLRLDGAVNAALANDATVTLDAASGHVVLAHDNAAFIGTIAIYAATLEIAATDGAGSGTLAFIGGSNAATLQIDGRFALGNTITGFGAADTIDLAGFGSSNATLGWTPDAAGGTLTLANGTHQHRVLHFAGSSLSAASFAAVPDGHGGTALIHH